MKRPFASEQQEMVAEFHDAMELPVGPTVELRMADLRASLLLEEAIETVEALGYRLHAFDYEGNEVGPLVTGGRDEAGQLHIRLHPDLTPDLAEVIDGLCDIKYVADGAAATFGVDLDPFFRAVHRSNMSKAGGPVRADGKRLKPEGWTRPDIAGMLGDLLAAEQEHLHDAASAAGIHPRQPQPDAGGPVDG